MSFIVEENDIDSLALGDRALVVCDVDEVVLEFITPFQDFMKTHGYELLARSFRLNGNIVRLDDGSEADAATVDELQEAFFAGQSDWQTPVDAASGSLKRLSADCDIVFLTAMPPRHAGIRRALLDRHAMPYPMISSENAKGPLVEKLHRGRHLPVAFIDDIFTNLHSVRARLPACLLINLMANAHFRALAPHPGDGVTVVGSWEAAESLITCHIAGRP